MTSEITSILDAAVCLSLEIGRPGNRKKVPVNAIADPDKQFDRSMVGLSKQLLDSPEYKSIGQYDSETRRWLYAHSLPCTFTGRGGVYMIPKGLVMKVYETLKERATHRQDVLVPAFAAVYPEKVKEAETKLGPDLFDASDYPPTEEVTAEFQMSWVIFEYGAAQGLSEIRQEIFEEEKQKAAAKWQMAADDARNTLAAEFTELVNHMVDRLSDPSKKFKETLVSNVLEFLETFPFRNITGYGELAEQVYNLRSLLNNVTPEDLRKSSDIRGTVANGVKKIREQLEPMIVNRTPRRMIILEEEARA